MAVAPGSGRLVAPGVGGAESVVLFVEQPDRRPIAVDDPWERLRQPGGDLRRGPGLPEVVGQGEQRAHHLIAPGDVAQRHCHVEHRRGVLGVQLERQALLIEEVEPRGLAGDQPSVVLTARGDLDADERIGHRGLGRQRAPGELNRIVVAESAREHLKRSERPRPDGQYVLRRADLLGGALDDPVEHGADVVDRHQVPGGGVRAPQPLAHRHQLRLEGGDPLLRIAGLQRQRRVPRHLVDALLVASGLTRGLTDVGRAEAEQLRRHREQPLSPLTEGGGPAVAVPGSRVDNRASGPDLGGLEVGDGAELAGGLGDLGQHGLRRAERTQQRRHRRAGQPAHRLGTDPAGEVRIARQRRPASSSASATSAAIQFSS